MDEREGGRRKNRKGGREEKRKGGRKEGENNLGITNLACLRHGKSELHNSHLHFKTRDFSVWAL